MARRVATMRGSGVEVSVFEAVSAVVQVCDAVWPAVGASVLPVGQGVPLDWLERCPRLWLSCRKCMCCRTAWVCCGRCRRTTFGMCGSPMGRQANGRGAL